MLKQRQNRKKKLFPPKLVTTLDDTVRQNQASVRRELEKGNRNEERFKEALQILIHKEEIYFYYQARHGGELDRQGIDFLVFTAPSRAIPFQVKSSETGRKGHYAEYGARIRCVVVDPFITAEALAYRIWGETEEVILEELADVIRKQATASSDPVS